MKTREQERQERRTSRAVWIVCVTIIAVWVACLLCTCANSAYGEAEGETVKTWLAAIGGVTVSVVLTKAAVRLDTPRRK